MGDPEAARAVPRTELEEIASKISDLNKWREIFSFHGLEASSTAPQRRRSSDGDGPPGASEPAGPQPPCPPAPETPLVSPDTGGRPISLETAMGLQKLLFGNGSHVLGHEWAAGSFRFREPRSGLAYALEAEKGGPRAILMAVQAHIVKYLLFVRSTEHTHLDRLCRISRGEQGEALAAALADALWAAGGGGSAVVCLLAPATRAVPSGDHGADSLMGRMQLFEFSAKAAAQEFILARIGCFRGEGSPGVILFLCSLLFSRTLERVREDLGCTATPLLTHGFGNATCTQAMLSLILTGRASPHELDGGREAGGGDVADRRCPVGYLRWGRAQAVPEVRRGLRTPQLPIWLCSLSGRHGVLFGTDSLLLSDWKAERVFHLYFYSGQREQRETARLRIDTHSHPWEEDPGEGPSSPGDRRPSLEMAIRTKWAGATVSWSGTEPFF